MDRNIRRSGHYFSKSTKAVVHFSFSKGSPEHQILRGVGCLGAMLSRSKLYGTDNRVAFPFKDQNLSSLSCAGDLKGLRPRALLGQTFSLATARGLVTPAQPRSMSGESAGFSGATLRERLGLPLVEHGAEREVGKGAEKGSKGEGRSELTEGSALRLKGSQSGDGKGSQFVKGLVGEGWYPRRGLVGLLAERFREPLFSVPPAEMKLQGSIRARMGDGRGRGIMLTSRRRVLGLQRRGSGYRAMGDLSSASTIVSWHKGRSNTKWKEKKERKKNELTQTILL